jgi:hypothetical protein
VGAEQAFSDAGSARTRMGGHCMGGGGVPGEWGGAVEDGGFVD